MKSKRSLFCCISIVMAFLAIQSDLKAQEEKRFTVKAGYSIANVLSFEEMYRYPEFKQGTVAYKDGSTKDEILNYNIVIGDMLFINSRRDTLVVANSASIDFITIEDNIFYFNDGCFEKVAGNGKVMLLVKHYMKLMDIKKEGAYGTSNSTAAIDNYTSYSAGNNTSTYRMKAAQDIVYSFEVEYYFGRIGQDYVFARENNLLKTFPENKDKIKQFIKDQKLSFNKKEDLIKLTEFLQGLS